MTTRGIEERLAAFATGTGWEAIAPDARDRTVDLTLDAIACAFTGRDADGRDGFAAVAAALGDGDGYPVIGDAPHALGAATLLNGWQITATTMCDVYRPLMCHVTPVVVPAALASLGSTGRPAPSREEFLAAIALGAEITVRLCDAMDASWYLGPRWHAPGVIGPYGSATTAALLRGADDETLRRAWGSAGLQSSGTFSSIGTPGVKFTQARAALAGVLASELAAAGHGASDHVLTHPDGGLFDAYAGGDPERAVAGLGEDWRLMGISLRRWPAASSLQTVVEAVLSLADADPQSPDGIEIALPPLSYKLCAAMGWDSELSALQSARWMSAVVWTDRSCWIDQFTDARRADAAVAALAGHLTVVQDDSLRPGAARVTATRTGVARTETRDAMPGSPERPLSRDEIVAKLERAAGAERARRIHDLITGATEWDAAAVREALR